jgi:hypothetical protein
MIMRLKDRAKKVLAVWKQQTIFGKPEVVAEETAPASSPFDRIMHDEGGVETWYGREFLRELGYSLQGHNFAREFQDVIKRAKIICEAAGHRPEDHFLNFEDMVGIGSGASRKVYDVKLSRRAAYYVALVADEGKPQVALAKNYFAEQTRAQEVGKAKAKAKAKVRPCVKQGRRRGNHAEDWEGARGIAANMSVFGGAVFGQSMALVHDGVNEGLFGKKTSEVKEGLGIPDWDTPLNYQSAVVLAMYASSVAEHAAAAQAGGSRKNLRATARGVASDVKRDSLKRMSNAIGECALEFTEDKDGYPRIVVVPKQLPAEGSAA